MYKIIMEVLEKHMMEVDNSNNAVFECDFEKVVNDICEEMQDNF